ncbi:PLP-dependent transferase [Penicillium sp. IBT 16267x]|nr:PLP-dependent transferase [Penicillium sp. IBT 16267x]
MDNFVIIDPPSTQQAFGHALREKLMFDKGFINLNRGSFGTYPIQVQQPLRHAQELAEARPDAFIRYEYPKLLDKSRSTLYGACEKTINYIYKTTPAKSIRIEFRYPLHDDNVVSQFTNAIRQMKNLSAGSRVKIALFDVITSLPGVRVPFERLTKVCRQEGVLSLINSAHALSHIELDLERVRPDFFVANYHNMITDGSFHREAALSSIYRDNITT